MIDKEQLQARARELGISEGQVRHLSAKRLLEEIQVSETNLRTLGTIAQAASGNASRSKEG